MTVEFNDPGSLENAVQEVLRRINRREMIDLLYGAIACVHMVDESMMRAEIRKRRGWKPLKRRKKRKTLQSKRTVDHNNP